ncbi:unnamed protein product [Paramecium sonneborni]|uniref:Uncharacterized protein n=1 Tax=Paramecium sonneborni TaxID=65129 RepID=A0A8S1PSQ6_9CILI|nr:unnamed protein product [Paramecium sonneborni]
MFKPKMKKIYVVVLDPKLPKDQRLLCIECLENTDTDGKVVGEENQIKRQRRQKRLLLTKQSQLNHCIVLSIK